MKIKQKKKLLKQLESIEDFRRHRDQIVYPLSEILFMSLFALIKGDTTFSEIHFTMSCNKENKIFKKLFGKTKIRIPSRSTLHRILMNTSNDGLEVVFRDYFSKYVSKKNIACDGKWLRGSDVKGQYSELSHKLVLNILDKDTKIVMGHKFIEKDKSHEIPAFTEILKDKTFCEEGQIFTFDALMTQMDILNTINTQKNKYIAKVKNNQKLLKDKVVLTVDNFVTPIETYEDSKLYKTENSNKSVKRTVDIFYTRDTNIVMYHDKCQNIQTIIRVTKESINLISGEIKITIEYLIANFKTTAEDFYNKILQHWRVETYHYHLDMLTKEDDHICYINPFSISILRSFTINLYQLYLNKYKGTKILDMIDTTMANIKKYTQRSDDFISDIFEL
jgi:predicted transposase YbfD/YdcC